MRMMAVCDSAGSSGACLVESWWVCTCGTSRKRGCRRSARPDAGRSEDGGWRAGEGARAGTGEAGACAGGGRVESSTHSNSAPARRRSSKGALGAGGSRRGQERKRAPCAARLRSGAEAPTTAPTASSRLQPRHAPCCRARVPPASTPASTPPAPGSPARALGEGDRRVGSLHGRPTNRHPTPGRRLTLARCTSVRRPIGRGVRTAPRADLPKARARNRAF
jgi:hypothetical protein